jgi:hypothetical protein
LLAAKSQVSGMIAFSLLLFFGAQRKEGSPAEKSQKPYPSAGTRDHGREWGILSGAALATTFALR